MTTDLSPFKKGLLALGFLLLFSTSLDAQWTFQIEFGGSDLDYAQAAIKSPDGGYMIAGITKSFGQGDSDAYLMRMDSVGTILWTRIYGQGLMDNPHCLLETYDGGYALGGYSSSFSGSDTDFMVVRTDSFGNLLWSTVVGTPGYDQSYRMVETRDKGLVMIGNTGVPSTTDVLMVKFDSAGNLAWTRTYGTPDWDKAADLLETQDGGFIFCGSSAPTFYSDDHIFVVKTDSLGNIEWANSYDGPGTEWCGSMLRGADNNYYISGVTTSYAVGDEDFMLVKIKPHGEFAWAKTYGDTLRDAAAYGLFQNSNGGFVMSGFTENGAGGGVIDFMMIRTDSIGGLQWGKWYGSDRIDYGYELVEEADGGYTIFGNSKPWGSSFNYEGLLVRTNAEGLSGCNEGSMQLFSNEAPMVRTPLVLTQDTAGAVINHSLVQDTASFAVSVRCLILGNEEPEPVTKELILSPNPAHSILRLSFPYTDENSYLRIIDLQGRTVLEKTLPPQIMDAELDLSDMPRGSYLVGLVQGAAMYSKRLLLVH